MSQSPPSPDNESSNIFINYRRADTSGHAGRLEQELSRRFPGRVFMDILRHLRHWYGGTP